MSKSLLQKHKECYITGRTDNLQKHHIFAGYNRKWSEKYGLWIWLTADRHTLSDHSVHWGDNTLDLALKEKAQVAFEKKYSHEKFMQVFGRSWL